MKFEDQVTNLELSKRLKELGVKQESLFYWGETLTGRHSETEFNLYFNEKPACNILREYSSFTVSELLEMLPDYLDDAGCLKIEKHNINVNDEGITYFIEYGYGYYEHQDKNLSNALAKMLIHLIENKFIEV